MARGAITSARGRFLRASASSGAIEDAAVQPSNENAMGAAAASHASEPPRAAAPCAAATGAICAVPPRSAASPMAPTATSGTALSAVVRPCSQPDALGARALRAPHARSATTPMPSCVQKPASTPATRHAYTPTTQKTTAVTEGRYTKV